MNLKWLLVLFEKLLGMNMNYNKSNLLSIGLDIEEEKQMEKLFCGMQKKFPLKYLAVPLHFSKLINEDLHPIVNKIIRRVASWNDRLLPYGGNLFFLKFYLVSIS
jgi:hypothetical protein